MRQFIAHLHQHLLHSQLGTTSFQRKCGGSGCCIKKIRWSLLKTNQVKAMLKKKSGKGYAEQKSQTERFINKQMIAVARLCYIG